MAKDLTSPFSGHKRWYPLDEEKASSNTCVSFSHRLRQAVAYCGALFQERHHIPDLSVLISIVQLKWTLNENTNDVYKYNGANHNAKCCYQGKQIFSATCILIKSLPFYLLTRIVVLCCECETVASKYSRGFLQCFLFASSRKVNVLKKIDGTNFISNQ